MYRIYVKFECHEGKREAFVRAVKETGILAAIISRCASSSVPRCWIPTKKPLDDWSSGLLLFIQYVLRI